MRNILIVDDDREWNMLLKMYLERAGFKGEQAFNGEEAVKKIIENRPDLVLLDISMPKMDGWELCKRIRSQTETKELPIIVLSCFSQPEDIERGKSFQVKRFIVKPCALPTVINNVIDIFKQHT